MFFILSHSRPKGKGRRASFSLRPKRTYQPLPPPGAAAIPKRSRAFYAAKKILRSAQDDMFSPPVILGSTALPRVILRRRSPSPCHPEERQRRRIFPHPAGAIRKKILRSAQDDRDGGATRGPRRQPSWVPERPTGRQAWPTGGVRIEQAPGRSGEDQKVTRSSSQFFS